MGKKILVQRRGRGTSLFRANTHKRKGAARYRKLSPLDYEGKITARILELLHDPGRGAPVARLLYEDGVYNLLVCAEGISVGQTIEQGKDAEIEIGNILPLEHIPEGTTVYSIEKVPGDGGKFVRASGLGATVLTKTEKYVQLQMPSGELKLFAKRVRATVGLVAGGGRTEMPFVKAGTKYHNRKAKGHQYPTVRGVAMNTVSHPHGGGSHQSPPRSTCVSRHSPPGRKVGLIAARQTGLGKGRKRRK